jgi:DNA mismatch repair protein MutS
MKQYTEIKEKHSDAILFYRLGDFYEMFHEDAQIASEELGITLTARGKDESGPIPLAGIPYHAYKGYAATLLSKGYKVAICEQIEDPRAAKGIVKRAVKYVLTPGTVLDDDFLSGENSNYILCLNSDGEGWAITYCDISAGDVHCMLLCGSRSLRQIIEEIRKINPAELLIPESIRNWPQIVDLVDQLEINLGLVTSDGDLLMPHQRGGALFFRDNKLSDEVKNEPLLCKTLAIMAGYISRMQDITFQHFNGVQMEDPDSNLGLDIFTIRNLELLSTIIGNNRHGSLIGVLDKTVTSMGKRLLKYRILHPLSDIAAISKRLDDIEALLSASIERDAIRELLKRVYDIPRIVSRVATGRANGRDLAALRSSLAQLPEAQSLCNKANLSFEGLGNFDTLLELLKSSISDEPPILVTEGGIIAPGYSKDLDRLRNLHSNISQWMENFQNDERQRTGIKSLKVRFNKVFGYYIDVTKSNLSMVPDDYIRKQTLVSSERFVTDELRIKEKEILNADEEANKLEYEIFLSLRESVSKYVCELQEAAVSLASLDVLQSLALVSETNNYVRPTFNERGKLSVVSGRHPVVELLANSGGFVPNNVSFERDKRQLAILTGPNMSGKSTYLRQTALLVLMAQMGSFVPASEACLPIVDRIFTRVGAGDDLSRGESTFMVEMKETANILRNATSNSLVIFDEVGRGTSTYDGLSIAWAIVEYLNQSVDQKAMTLFATHYHELSEMADIYSGIVNLSVLVEEDGEEITFLHRIVEGCSGRSYGIHVARLAGFPQVVLDKANEVLNELERDEQRDIARKKLHQTSRDRKERESVQLSLFSAVEYSPVLEGIRDVDLNTITPLEALNLLSKWKKML